MSRERYICAGREKANVLILAVWALFFLAMLAVVVAERVSADLAAAKRLRDRTVSYYLARAGVQWASAVAAADSNGWDALGDSWSSGREVTEDIELDGGSFLITRGVTSRVGVATERGLVDEERKINVNEAGKELLAAFFEIAGEMDVASASGLAEAVVSLRDGGDKPEGKAPPGRFSVPEELLLVEGFSQDLLARIKDRITVFGHGKVNLNTADKTVLASLALSVGADSRATSEQLAGKIRSFVGAGNCFKQPSADAILLDLEKVEMLVPEEKSLFVRMLDSGRVAVHSTCLGGVSWGIIPAGTNTARRILFVFDREVKDLRYWHEY